MFCIVAIFKNESEILKEWLDHYINEGCSKFFMIDNGSTDEYSDIVKNYENIEIVKDPTKHSQAHLYQKYYINKVRNYEWVLICDLDEFVYSRKEFNTTTDYLKTVNDEVSCILIPWKIFGSNGYNTEDKKEPDSVVKNFTKRCIYNSEILLPGIKYIKEKTQMGLCKSFIRTKTLKSFGIHISKTNCGKTIQPNNEYVCTGEFIPISEKILDDSYLHLNHYAIRSLDWFKRVKMARGSAASDISEKKKSSLKYFFSFDRLSNKKDDVELKNKKYN